MRIRVTVQVAQGGPRLPGLTPDSIQQKNTLKPSCRRGSSPVACIFWGGKRFYTAWTQSGLSPASRQSRWR